MCFFVLVVVFSPLKELLKSYSILKDIRWWSGCREYLNKTNGLAKFEKNYLSFSHRLTIVSWHSQSCQNPYSLQKLFPVLLNPKPHSCAISFATSLVHGWPCTESCQYANKKKKKSLFFAWLIFRGLMNWLAWLMSCLWEQEPVQECRGEKSKWWQNGAFSSTSLGVWCQIHQEFQLTPPKLD